MRWVLLLFITLTACQKGCWDFTSKTTCGNGVCETGERCETCAADCGKCNVCGDGKCSVTEIENCETCPKDCACPTILTCARELTLPPRCILAVAPACTDGTVPQQFTFCLVEPGKPIDDCVNRQETTVTACSKEEAEQIAKAGAANWNIQSGACPACCGSPPCH